MSRKRPIQISLPRPLAAWLDQRVQRGEFADLSECIEHAVRHEQAVRTQADLEAAAIRGIESGPAKPMTRADWSRIRRQLRSRIAARADAAAKPRKRSA